MRHPPNKPTKKLIRAHFDAQAPLDREPQPYVRKKPVKRDWDEKIDDVVRRCYEVLADPNASDEEKAGAEIVADWYGRN